MAMLCLAVAVLAIFTNSAEATKKFYGKGKGVGVSFTTHCQPVCKDVCTMVPRAVCTDVQVPYQACAKVPVTASVQKCDKVCQKTITTVTPVVTPVMGKGKSLIMGKGRLLMSAQTLPLYGKGKGKGMISAAPLQCDTVCRDIPVTRFETSCQTLTRTQTQCAKTFEQACTQRCKQSCVKVPVMVEPQPIVVQHPVVVSKGKGMPFLGKGH